MSTIKDNVVLITGAITDPERRKWIEELQHNIGLKSSDVADAVAYAIGTPDTVNVRGILMVPAKQA